jgi:hypothetical protein
VDTRGDTKKVNKVRSRRTKDGIWNEGEKHHKTKQRIKCGEKKGKRKMSRLRQKHAERKNKSTKRNIRSKNQKRK